MDSYDLSQGQTVAAIKAYVDLRFRADVAKRGEPYDLAYAGQFHYIGPDTLLDEYIKRHAVAL